MRRGGSGPSGKQLRNQFLACQSVVPCHVIQYCRKGADSQRRMVGNGDMVLPAFGGCETNMAARLSRYGVARRDNLFASSLPEMSRGSLTER